MDLHHCLRASRYWHFPTKLLTTTSSYYSGEVCRSQIKYISYPKILDVLFVITLHLSCQPVEGYSRSLPQWGNSSWSISSTQLLLLTRPKWRTGRESNPLKILIAFVPVYRTSGYNGIVDTTSLLFIMLFCMTIST